MFLRNIVCSAARATLAQRGVNLEMVASVAMVAAIGSATRRLRSRKTRNEKICSTYLVGVYSMYFYDV